MLLCIPSPRRALAAFAATLLGALALLALLAPAGNAAFTTSKCFGDDIIGRGASFARDAHNSWINQFQLQAPGGYCFGLGDVPGVSYEALGSGAGRRVVGERTGDNADGSKSRNQPPRFGMTDEPPSTTGISQMNQGTDAVGDEGEVHVVPAAVGSVAPIVNFPNGCDVNLLPAAAKTDEQDLDGDATPDDAIRMRFTRPSSRRSGRKDTDADDWSEICGALGTRRPIRAADDNVAPIIRVVRFDDSGTSFAFKDYLDRS